MMPEVSSGSWEGQTGLKRQLSCQTCTYKFIYSLAIQACLWLRCHFSHTGARQCHVVRLLLLGIEALSCSCTFVALMTVRSLAASVNTFDQQLWRSSFIRCCSSCLSRISFLTSFPFWTSRAHWIDAPSLTLRIGAFICVSDPAELVKHC